MNNLIQDLLSRKKELEIIIKKSKQIIRQAPAATYVYPKVTIPSNIIWHLSLTINMAST